MPVISEQININQVDNKEVSKEDKKRANRRENLIKIFGLGTDAAVYLSDKYRQVKNKSSVQSMPIIEEVEDENYIKAITYPEIKEPFALPAPIQREIFDDNLLTQEELDEIEAFKNIEVKINEDAKSDILPFESGIYQYEDKTPLIPRKQNNEIKYDNTNLKDLAPLLGTGPSEYYRAVNRAKTTNPTLLKRNLITDLLNDNLMKEGHNVIDKSVGSLEWKNQIIDETNTQNDYLKRALNQSLYDAGFNSSRERIARTENPLLGSIYNNEFIKTAVKESNTRKIGYSKLPTTYYRQNDRTDLMDMPRTIIHPKSMFFNQSNVNKDLY